MSKSRHIWLSWQGLVLIAFVLLALLAIIFPIETLSQKLDIAAIYQKPFQNINHLLGTDAIGRSVLYGLWNGCKIAFIIGLITSMVALVIALVLGFLSGYLGNEKFVLRPISLATIILLLLLSVFYSIYTQFDLVIFAAALGLGLLVIYLDRKSKGKKIAIPLDSIILKLIVLFKSVPGIILVLFLLALFPSRSIWNVIIVITLFRWTNLTRIIRADIKKLSTNEFIKAAENSGITKFQLLRNHIYPNIKDQIFVHLIYGFAATILIEAGLSFLGIGLPVETVSWGTMLMESRNYFKAWWLAIFPGIAIFLIVTALRSLVEKSENETLSYL